MMKHKSACLKICLFLISAMCAVSLNAADTDISLSEILQAVQKNTDILKENIIDLISEEEITIEEFNNKGKRTRIANIVSEYRIFPEKTTSIADCRIVYEIMESISSAGIMREEREILSAKENNRTQRLDRYEFKENIWAKVGSYIDLFILFDKQNEQCFEYELTGVEKNNGRDVYIIDIEQKETDIGIKETGKNEQITWKVKYGSSAWIDADTMEVVRLSRESIDLYYAERPGKSSIFDIFPVVTARFVFFTHFFYEKIRIGNQFLTLPVAKTVELFRPDGKLNTSYKYRYSDYRAFTVDTKILFVK